MNSTFFTLNRKKIFFFFKFCGILFALIFFLLFLLISVTQKNIGPIEDIILFFIIFSIGLPSLIFILSFFAWEYNKKTRTRLFSTTPLNQLKSLGFSNYLQNENTNYFFTEEILGGYISNVFITVDLLEKDSKKISFKTFIKCKNHDSILDERLQRKNINLSFCIASRNYTRKNLHEMSINFLKTNLNNLLEFFI